MSFEEWENLRTKLSDGDRSAFENLYNSLWSKLYSIAFNYVRERETSEEMVQETFVKLWLKRRDLVRVNDIMGFAVRTLQFKVFDYFDSKAIEERYLSRAMKTSVLHVDDTNQQVEYDEMLSRLNDELEKLPDTTRTIFRLSRFNHFTNEEIASNLSLSVKTVEYHITQSLKHLRLRLGDLLSLLIGLWLLIRHY